MRKNRTQKITRKVSRKARRKSRVTKIYRVDYMSPDNILHHKYYSCLTTGNAVSQFEAGCEHKSIEVESFQVYECQPGCYKWELVLSRENDTGGEECGDLLCGL